MCHGKADLLGCPCGSSTSDVFLLRSEDLSSFTCETDTRSRFSVWRKLFVASQTVISRNDCLGSQLMLWLMNAHPVSMASRLNITKPAGTWISNQIVDSHALDRGRTVKPLFQSCNTSMMKSICTWHACLKFLQTKQTRDSQETITQESCASVWKRCAAQLKNKCRDTADDMYVHKA